MVTISRIEYIRRTDMKAAIASSSARTSRRSLVPADPTSEVRETKYYDDYGRLTGTSQRDALGGSLPALDQSSRDSAEGFDHEALDGSWYLTLTPRRSATGRETVIHGAMRVESQNPNVFRVSGDVYIEAIDCETPPASFPRNPLVIDGNWYPQFSPSKYGWYFESGPVQFRPGAFGFGVTQEIWDTVDDDFGDSRAGSMAFYADPGYFQHESLPTPTIRLQGVASLDDGVYEAVAYKTSPYYRGCVVEIDVMTNQSWTGEADVPGSGTVDYNSVYRSVGLDFHAVIDERDVPDDWSVTIPELERLFSNHRSDLPFGPDTWHIWLLICSRLGTTDALGMMFDETPPYREGVAVFADPRLGDDDDVDSWAREKHIGDVPLAILRTALHEVGHAFNLYHPRDDAHPVPAGTTLMNQTADLMDRATPTSGFPSNSVLVFHEHNCRSLIHSPDPQVRPGWKPFGYGHGGVGSAPNQGGDLTFDRSQRRSGLRLDLTLPDRVYIGEFSIADLRVSNEGDADETVISALNAREDHLRLRVTTPDGSKRRIKSPVLVCSNRRPTTLGPQDSQQGFVQLLHANRGHPFEQAGRHVVTAELDAGPTVLRSDPQTVVVGTPAGETESTLSSFGLDETIGRSVGLGYPTDGTEGAEKLEAVADAFPRTDLGTAAALILANASARERYDYRRDRLVTRSELRDAGRYLDVAFDEYDSPAVARIAAAILPPGEEDSPVFYQLEERLADADESDRLDALDILDDFRRNVDCRRTDREGGDE